MLVFDAPTYQAAAISLNYQESTYKEIELQL